MKTTRYIITLAALAVAAFTQAFAATSLPAPLPERMNKEQLVKWRTEKSTQAASGAAHQSAQSQSNGSDAFFTGKTIDSDTGNYLFRFRNYDPELSRWITLDPSGFPDGANNLAYMPVPTSQFDYQGLETKDIFHTFAIEGVDQGLTVEGTIQATWGDAPTVEDKRISGETGGSFVLNFGVGNVTTSWTASDPNIILDNPQFNEGPTVNDDHFGDWTAQVTYKVTYEATFTGEAGVEFNYQGFKIKLGTGGSTTQQWTLSSDGSVSISVKE